MGNLNENSLAYYSLNNFYELFSAAEDFPGLISKKLEQYSADKTVLDAGCGTGKFYNALSRKSKTYLGIDKSEEQIKIASQKNNGKFTTCDLLDLNLTKNKFDIIVSCWCLGTIELNKRIEVLNNLKQHCNESIFLIENLPNSEFEKIRYGNNDYKTKEYLSFLDNNNFKLFDTIDTFFKFNSIEEAKEIFTKIYNEKIAENINSNTIQHKVGIFRLDVK